MLAGLGLLAVAGCESTPPPDPGLQRPPRYGQGGTESPKPPDRRSRFGYTGQEGPADRRDASPAPGNDPQQVAGNSQGTPAAPAQGGQSSASTPPAPAPKPPEKKPAPTVETMPYARGVPGNPLAVTLPSPYDKLGPISVEKYDASGNPTGKAMDPGTPVEIKDPNDPGKKIRFRVP